MNGLDRNPSFGGDRGGTGSGLTSLVMRRRDRLLDAIKDLSERVTRVETRLEGLDKRVEGLDKRVESIEGYIRSKQST